MSSPPRWRQLFQWWKYTAIAKDRSRVVKPPHIWMQCLMWWFITRGQSSVFLRAYWISHRLWHEYLPWLFCTSIIPHNWKPNLTFFTLLKSRPNGLKKDATDSRSQRSSKYSFGYLVAFSIYPWAWMMIMMSMPLMNVMAMTMIQSWVHNAACFG